MAFRTRASTPPATDQSAPASLAWAVAPLGAVAILLAGAAVARAEITASSVTKPAPSPYFAIVDEDTSFSPTIPFEGTTDSTAPLSDTVDLDCFTNNDLSQTEVFLGASVAPAGSFAAEANALNLAGKLCQLRAVPHGSPPADVTPFAGPITAVGRSRTEELEFGANIGTPYDYYVYGQQLDGGNDYYSLSSCGVNGYLYDALEYTAKTFSCSDWYAGFDELNTPSSTRSEIQVDGTDAYGATAVGELANGAAGFPTFGFSYSQDPGNGDLTIEEDDQISTCPGQAYPPDGCPAFADSGVGDERRIEQTHGGRLVEITDRFSSTDGLPHNLDLLPQQGVRLSASSPAQVAYRFPGQSGFATHSSGESVPFAAGAPGVVYMRAPGAPDGDTATGQAAIVFDRPSSPATFNTIYFGDSDFHFHQQVAVPATGAATVRFAYVQGYASAEVEALAEEVERSFGTGGGGAGGGGAGAEPTPPTPPEEATPHRRPPNAFAIVHRRLQPKRGSAVLTAAVHAPGRLRLSGKGLQSVRRRARHAGRVKLPVRPGHRLARRLARRGRARVRVLVAFRPDGGSPRRRAIHLTLRETGRRPG